MEFIQNNKYHSASPRKREDYVVVVDEGTKHMEEIESIGSSGNAPIRPQQILSQMNIHGQSKQARQERLRVLGEQRLHL